MDGVEQEGRLSDYIYEVQTILLEEQKSPGTWEELSRKVGDYGFSLYVTDRDTNMCFSNIQPKQKEYIRYLENTKKPIKIIMKPVEELRLSRDDEMQGESNSIVNQKEYC